MGERRTQTRVAAAGGTAPPVAADVCQVWLLQVMQTETRLVGTAE